MNKRNKKNKRRRRVAPAGLALISLVGLGTIWFADAVYRAFAPEPEGAQTAWQTEAASQYIVEITGTTETTSVTDATDAVEIPDQTLPINDAGLGLLNKTNVPEGYMTVPQNEAEIHNGMLVQIDQNHSYTGAPGTLTTFQGKNDSYRMKRMDFSTRPEVLEAMNNMGSAYVSVHGTANLMVYSTVAAYDVAGSLYPDWLPDRSSGWCLDFCLLNEDETISKFETPNAWLKDNSWKYGFVFSYPEEDAAVTGVSAPYHLRYVGEVHAGIMHENALTLTNYYAFLRTHTFDVPLYYTVGDVTYTVYYVPAGSGTTEVPVPLNKEYDLSGDNSEGYIVTVKG